MRQHGGRPFVVVEHVALPVTGHQQRLGHSEDIAALQQPRHGLAGNFTGSIRTTDSMTQPGWSEGFAVHER